MKSIACLITLSLCGAVQAQGTGISCSGDFNLDGIVDGEDLSGLLGAWGTKSVDYDIDGNGAVEGFDLAIMLGQWGQDCNPFNAGIVIVWGDTVATVSASGLPDHPTGPFDGSDGCFNPNTPSLQNDNWMLPLTPVPTDDPDIDVLAQLGPIGVLVTGAAFYNAYDGGGVEAPGNICMDACEGHPSPDGRYHYHQYSPCIGEAPMPMAIRDSSDSLSTAIRSTD